MKKQLENLKNKVVVEPSEKPTIQFKKIDKAVVRQQMPCLQFS